MIKSTTNSEHYTWGNNCDGWHLLKTGSLSVIQEKMPPGTAEQYHYHHKAQQLFYILSGTATFTVEEEKLTVRAGESIHIKPGMKHSIANLSEIDLDFLVISEPKAHGDRENETRDFS
jgi:mannose-6-phosphate isomerase-like protein (cupin superfamily)